MLTCVVPLFTSCVEGDLYDLYDEDMSTDEAITKKKMTKDNSTYNCGVCSAAYIMGDGDLYDGLDVVLDKCNKRGMDINYGTTWNSGEMQGLMNDLYGGDYWHYMSRTATNSYGMSVDLTESMKDVFRNESYPMILIIPNHIVVATGYYYNWNHKLKVNYYDAQAGQSGSYFVSEIDGVIY